MPVPLRVLYVDNTFTFGGAIESLSILICGFDRAHLSAVVVTGQPEEVARTHFPAIPTECWEPRLPWISPDPVVGVPTAERLARLNAVQRVGRAAYWFFSHTVPRARRLARLGHRYEVDLVHLNNIPESQPEGILGARLLGVPCVAHCRAHPDRSLYSARLLTTLPDHHIAVSASVRRSLLDVGVPESHVTLVPNAVDLDRFEPGPAPESLARTLGIPPDRRIVGHVGRVVPWKGQREFLRAFASVARSLPDAHALVVGDHSDGPDDYQRALLDRANCPDLRGRVTLAGFRPDVDDVMRLCDVVVHTSTKPEPFGRVLIEAMALARPIVAADSGGPRDIVLDGETGYLVDPSDPRAVATSILHLLTHPEERERMGRAGARRAHEVFSGAAHVARVAAVYDIVLRRHGRGHPEGSSTPGVPSVAPSPGAGGAA